MVLSKLNTYAMVGIEAIAVEAEIDVAATGLPTTQIVGQAETSVRESVHRVDRALLNSGYRKAGSRVIVNLAPGDLKKDATAFDLPIALGMLVGTEQVSGFGLSDVAVVGELALDGSTRSVKGVLSMAMRAKEQGFRAILVPTANAREAAVVDGLDVYAIDSLASAVGLITDQLDWDPAHVDIDRLFESQQQNMSDYVDVKGQESTKRALTIAAAGKHNMLML